MKFNMEKFVDVKKGLLDDRGIYNKEISEATENKLSQKGYPKKFITQNSKEVLEDLVDQKISYSQFKKLATPARKDKEISTITNKKDENIMESDSNQYHEFFKEQTPSLINTNTDDLSFKEKVNLDNSIFHGTGLDREFPNEFLNPMPHISQNTTLRELFSHELNKGDESANHVFENKETLIDAKTLGAKQYENPEYNKRLNQLLFLKEHLENQGARIALYEIIELLKNEPNFFQYIKDFQRKATLGKVFYMTKKPYSVESLLSTFMGSASVGAFSLFGQVIAGMKGPDVVFNSYAAIFAVTAILYAKSSYKYEKSKKQNNNVIKSMDKVVALFDVNLIDYLYQNYQDEIKRLHTHITVRDHEKPEYQAKINEFIYGHRLPIEQRKTQDQVRDEYINQDPQYKEYKNQLRILENLKNILEKDDTDSVLPTLNFINNFTGLVNDIYAYGGEGKNVHDIARNIIDKFIENPRNIKNAEIARLLVRCGLKSEDTDFNRNLFTKNIEKILMSDTVKFVVNNDESVKWGMVTEMKKEMERMLPVNAEIIHSYFAHGVDNATKHYETYGDYQLEKKSDLNDLQRKINESTENQNLREAYESEYMQKCEFDEREKSKSIMQKLKKIPEKMKHSLFKMFISAAE